MRDSDMERAAFTQKVKGGKTVVRIKLMAAIDPCFMFNDCVALPYRAWTPQLKPECEAWGRTEKEALKHLKVAARNYMVARLIKIRSGTTCLPCLTGVLFLDAAVPIVTHKIQFDICPEDEGLKCRARTK